MNQLIITGNLVYPPEARTTPTGVPVTTFLVAVTKRKAGANEKSADYFKVSAWKQLAESCAQHLDKGRKVAVVGEVSCSAYMGKDGTPRAQMEINASKVEFLTPRSNERYPESDIEREQRQQAAQYQAFETIEDDDLPFK